jgi:transcriptional regulator with XRE-family HTH domain
VQKDDFKKRVRFARETRGLSQTELASRMGCQPSAVGHLEAGRRKPGVDNLRILCVALSVSSDYLLGLSEDMAGNDRSVFSSLERLTSDEIGFIQTAIDAKVL